MTWKTGNITYIGDSSRKVTDWRPLSGSHGCAGILWWRSTGSHGINWTILQDLGVEVLYFNPLFVSPSNHKYDIQDYDYIDPHYRKDC